MTDEEKMKVRYEALTLAGQHFTENPALTQDRNYDTIVAAAKVYAEFILPGVCDEGEAE